MMIPLSVLNGSISRDGSDIVDEMGLMKEAKLQGRIGPRLAKSGPQRQVAMRQGYTVEKEPVDRVNPFPFTAKGDAAN
jgi:hypothetical protein